MKTKGLILGTLLMLLSLGSTCESEPKIRLGINPWPGYELLWLASKLNLYEKHGLDVEIFEYTSLVDAQTAMSRGQINVLCSTLIEVFLVSLPSGDKPIPILVTDYSNGADVMMAHKKKIEKVTDLEGKRVALEAGSLGEYIFTRALQIHHLNPKKIDLIQMDQTKMADALANGLIDAAVTYPPISTQLMRKDDYHVIFSSADIPHEVIDTVSITPKLLKSHPLIKEKIWRVWQDAYLYFETHREAALKEMAKHEGIHVEELEAALRGMKLLTISDQQTYFGPKGTLIQVMNNIREVLIKNKLIEGEQPVPVIAH